MLDILYVVLRCSQQLYPKVRYVFDTLLMPHGVNIIYSDHPPSDKPWILYGPNKNIFPNDNMDRCVAIAHCPEDWAFFNNSSDIEDINAFQGLTTVFKTNLNNFNGSLDISFDLIANAFYFLSSWPERLDSENRPSRHLFSTSIYKRFEIPQDIVDQYLNKLIDSLNKLRIETGNKPYQPIKWPNDKAYTLILSHDVDFIPSGIIDNLMQGAKTIFRHVIRQHSPNDALISAQALLIALFNKRDPYGCVPEIIQIEKTIGVKSSFQIAVGHRHPNDVNYFVKNQLTRDYLRCIIDNDFDLCLHGSYRSTEIVDWYIDEAQLLAEILSKPLGSRQHFLSFHYDNLFTAQERVGIEYDMSMGYPDATGPRAGFSYPYFPYCLNEDRPYKILQFSLFLMDVTLQSYMSLKGEKAWGAIKTTLDDLSKKGGCASVVWHPIVFGGARDPGYDKLFWRMIKYTQENGGLATDGRTINEFWRNLAKNYTSFR